MKRYCTASLLSLSFIICACQEEIYPPDDYAIVGTWLMYEAGLSPGAGYIVNQVPRVPPQTLTFSSNGKMQVEGDNLNRYQDFRYYRLIEDSTIMRIRFSKKASFKDFYEERIGVALDTLTLNPFCFEGCHSAFLRIKD